MLVYAWPGNVRELQNTIERAVILTGENLAVSLAALGLPVLNRPPTGNVPATVAEGGLAGGPGIRLGREPATSPGPSSAMNATLPIIQDESPVLSDPALAARDDAALPVEFPLTTPSEVLPLEEIEKRHILAALRHTNANRTRAAALLGISIRTLRNKLQEYRAAGIVIEGDDPPGE
jgi:DNA-binding NtrC family response regulator